MSAIDPGREVALVAGDATYTLYAGNRALRLMERETGQPLMELVDRFEQVEISLVTTILWALLQRHHPELSIDDVDDVIDAAGYEAVTEALGRAIEYAFPQTSPNGASEASGKAPARAGTGTRSQPSRSRPV